MLHAFVVVLFAFTHCKSFEAHIYAIT